MTWLQRYRFRHYARNSIWILPACAIVAAVVLARLLDWLEVTLGWEADNLNPEAVRSVLGNLAGAMFTFIVFVCSSLLLVVQLASAQLTPRIIGLLFRDRILKLTLTMFVFTFAFALAALVRIGATVPSLTAEIAIWSSVVCLGLFVFLIDGIGKTLRPSGAMLRVATQGHAVIDEVYSRRLKESTDSRDLTDATILPARTPRTVTSPWGGVVLAFDERGLVALAMRYDCVIELVAQVGTCLGPGNPLFRVYGGDNLPAEALLQSVAMGVERTIEQDPALAFRILVDIASKALSPAINDPTTAVLAIDRLHHLLRHVGSRRLDNERVRDASGQVRLIYRTPDWEDFVALAVTEIRHFGGSSIQIARRLRAMLEDVIANVPEDRAAPLRQELKLVKRSAERFFPEPEDRALADEGDAQGMGAGNDPQRVDGQATNRLLPAEQPLPKATP